MHNHLIFSRKISLRPSQKLLFKRSLFYERKPSKPSKELLLSMRITEAIPWDEFLGILSLLKLMKSLAMSTRLIFLPLSRRESTALKVMFQIWYTFMVLARMNMLWATLWLQSILKSPFTMFTIVSPGYMFLSYQQTQESFDLLIQLQGCFATAQDCFVTIIEGSIAFVYTFSYSLTTYTFSPSFFYYLYSLSFYFSTLGDNYFFSSFSRFYLTSIYCFLFFYLFSPAFFLPIEDSLSSPSLKPWQTASLILPSAQLNLIPYFFSYQSLISKHSKSFSSALASNCLYLMGTDSIVYQFESTSITNLSSQSSCTSSLIIL